MIVIQQKVFDLEDDWMELKQSFQKRFDEENLEINDQQIEYQRSGEHLRMSRDGKVSGGMPLHSNEIENAEKIKVSDSEIEVISKNSHYSFKR